MKKDRNCNMYPTYPMPYMPPMNQGMMPYMGMMPTMPTGNMMNSTTTDYNSISSQLNSLERRVSNLEAIVGNNTNYNNSTYQMM